ncbi:hypothetical protein NEMIN01_1409 [Nematocida minor]|uniref:uncharacterized protein n=1 Tax=Nematocida minor TaxID=1912983 RepID=UPI00221E7DF6|nr:uncharacterized protein NEMIN01_1409 [Nematocida minor]KAI5191201.1 hypothetical protein NEMIN01_1409 [Nematocida minor]
MSAYSTLKEKLLNAKYWILRYSTEEVFARKILSNQKTDSIKDIGFLISASFMDSKILNIALKIAFKRLGVCETILFSKHIQYYKSLVFLQKVCMESSLAKREVKKNHKKILPFIFYTKSCCNLDMSIRIASIAILKQINKELVASDPSHNTFITCVSNTYIEADECTDNEILEEC